MSTILRRLALVALAASIAATTGCGRKKAAASEESGSSDTSSSSSDSGSGMPSAKDLAEAGANLKKAAPFVGQEVGNAMQAMGKVMAQSENVTITPIDFRTLRDMLPESAAGLTRKSREGSKEMGMSTASADYGTEDGSATLHAKLTDSGQMRGMLAGGMAASLSMDMDKESETGYERNITLQGFRAHEEKNGDNLKLSTLVGDRFLVELDGYNVKPEQLKALLEALPLKKLEGLKDEGVEKAAK